MSAKPDLNALRDEMMRANGRYRAYRDAANEAQELAEFLDERAFTAQLEFQAACDRHEAAKESK